MAQSTLPSVLKSAPAPSSAPSWPRGARTKLTRAIANAAFCDPRSVLRALRGEPVRSLTLRRIQAVLENVGRLDLLPSVEKNTSKKTNAPKRTALGKQAQRGRKAP